MYADFYISTEDSGKSDSDDGNVAVRQKTSQKKINPMVQSVSFCILFVYLLSFYDKT